MSHTLTTDDILEHLEALRKQPYISLTMLQMDTYLWPNIQRAARAKLIRLLNARREQLERINELIPPDLSLENTERIYGKNRIYQICHTTNEGKP